MNRRRFLRGLGGAAIALPFLDAMGIDQALAAPNGFPKRFVVFFSANGTIPDNWTPGGGERDFSLGRILEPLEPHRDDLLVLSGIHHKTAMNDGGNGHARGMGHMLTCQKMVPDEALNNGFGDIGYAGGISIDQAIANELDAREALRFKSLEFGVQSSRSYGAHPYSRMSYAASEQPMPAMEDPQQAFDRIFGDLFSSGQDLVTLRAQRKSVLDFVADDYSRLEAELGYEDRIKVQQHLQNVRDIEMRITAPGQLGGSCQPPAMGDPYDVNRTENFPKVGREMMDLMAMSFACDLSRVASIQWSSAQSGINHKGWISGIRDKSHHGMSHDTDNDTLSSITEIDRWYAQQMAYLIDAMKAIPEGDGTMFDNTVIMWTSEVGVGNNHTYRGMPYVLAGSAGGALDTGRHVAYNDEPPHGELFTTLMNAMDIDAQTFGDPDWCDGPLTGLLA